MRVHIGSDHAGFELKNHLVQHLKAAGHDVVDHRLPGAQAVRRIVVHGVVHRRTVVRDVVPGSRQVLHQVVLQFEAGMVRADMHSHGTQSTCQLTCARTPPGTVSAAVSSVTAAYACSYGVPHGCNV